MRGQVGSGAIGTSPDPRGDQPVGAVRPWAWWIAGGYLVFGIAWIVWSDRFLGEYGTAKGVGYVVVTAVLLAVLIRRGLADAWATNARLAEREQELERVGSLYNALTRINQMIVRRPDRDELFAETCRILVETAGFDTTWIGRRDAEQHRLVPVARHGASTGFVDEVDVLANDRPRGSGPSGIALREGRPYICDDMLDDPAMAPWADLAARYPLRSLASFPFRVAGEDWGALVVYRTERGYFGDAEVDLLSQVADDLSHALDNLERDLETGPLADGAADRAAHPAQLDHRVHRDRPAGAGRPAHRRAADAARDGPRQRPPPVRADQRRARHLQDRGRATRGQL